MFHPFHHSGAKEEAYIWLLKQFTSLTAGESNAIANLANTAALLNHALQDINWVGFYLLEGEELVLGPFQGLPACVRIPLGKGVCGTAAVQKKTIRVDDVHQFPGHIACDAASNSEIVVPILKNGQLLGVLDIDSPLYRRFDETDEYYLEQLCTQLAKIL
ncbi:MAG: hypothetical protein A6D91_03390 [Bacillaceae bacterium G1]|nr:hypothetical protein [Bacillota bacterium]OJF17716.1 MAG: hypothetical protein A6D91_03390 [Bacillaceae bacterium G1]